MTRRVSRNQQSTGIVQVFVLSAFAFAQPLYDLLGSNATYFVARGSHPIDVWMLVLVVSVLVPTAIAGSLWVLGWLGQRVYLVALAGVQTMLVAGLVVVASRIWLGRPTSTVVAVGSGLLFAVAYRRMSVVSLFLKMLSPAVLVFPLVFVLASPVSKLAFPRSEVSPTTGKGSVGPDSHVVFVLLDLLPITALMDADQTIDANRFPGFARLQDQSVWYRRARTVSAATATAIPALLTGRYPRPGELGVLEDHPRNLLTLFGSVGEIHAFEPITRLCPESLCGESRDVSFRRRLSSLFRDTGVVALHLVLPDVFAANLPVIDSQWTSFESPGSELLEDRDIRRERLRKELKERAVGPASRDRLAVFDAFLDGLGDAAARNLSFLHLKLPHGPYEYLASGKRYVPDGKKFWRLRSTLGKISGRHEWRPEPYLVDLAYQRLTHQVMLADLLVGRLLDRLEELQLLDRTTLVITADHGESFEPNDHQRSMTDADTVHVPLFIKYPQQQQARIDDREVETVDVLPTIVETLGLHLDWQFDGYSLHPESHDQTGIAGREPRPLERGLEGSLLRKLERVGSGTRKLPPIGPRQDLLGRTVKDVFETLPSATKLDRVVLDQAEWLEDFDPDSGFVPAYLTGTVQDNSPSVLAISVNGVIRATAETFFSRSGDLRFALLVAESSFVRGKNSWSVLTVH